MTTIAPVSTAMQAHASLSGTAMRMRRLVMLALVAGTMGGLATMMIRILGTNGWDWTEVAMLVCFLLSVPYPVLGFWNAMVGFLLLHAARDGVASVNPLLRTADPDAAITSRTAVLMCVRHEDPVAVTARLALMRRELEATGFGDRFHFFVLSDSQRPEVATAEEAAFAAWRDLDPRPEELVYRRRRDNTGFKAGNIRDFCERWGDRYDFMLTLDADSLMGAGDVLRLVRVMQAHPRLGLLQSLVVGMPAGSFFARVFQFGMRQGMRTYTMGSAWWQGDCGPYWGHNALIRVEPFTRHCHLPALPGRPPLGGPVLSHDQIEAVLLRRAGYEVRVLPEEGESWEENPPALPDFVKRDLRWCQGNMQYWRLLGLPGLPFLSRVQLFLAILMYVGGPAWMGFILFGAVAAFRPPQGDEPFPAALGMTLFATMMFMTFAPKVLGVLDLAFRRSERERYGGLGRIVGGGVFEFLVMMLITPVIAFLQTMFLGRLFAGRAVIWEAQRRSGARVGWGAALRGLWVPTLAGLALFGVLAHAVPAALPWASPLLAAFVLSVPICVLTSSARLGRFARRTGLCAVPEEYRPAALPHALPGAIGPRLLASPRPVQRISEPSSAMR